MDIASMTCIVGIVDKGTVYIGGDSAGLSGWDLTIRADKKVFVNDGFAMGFTSSYRMGQLLAYALKPPQIIEGDDIMRFMTTNFIDAVRQTLKDGGYASKENESERSGCFLVGYRGRLFRIDSDYQVGERSGAFEAAGCGEAYALGALHVLNNTVSPEIALTKAMEVAESCSGGVRGPFHIVSV